MPWTCFKSTFLLLSIFCAGCGPKPVPPPVPPPEPQPAPSPIPPPPQPARPLAVVATFDPLTEEQAAAIFWTSKETRELLAQRGHTLRYLEQSPAGEAETAPAELRPYMIAAAAFQPAALVIGNAGEVLFAGTSPTTQEKLLPILTQAERAATPKDQFFDGRTWRKCGAKKPKAGLPIGTHPYGTGPDEPIVSPAEFRDVNLEHLCPPTLDQDGYNSCTACGATGAQRVAITRTGMPDDQLSVVDLYCRINSGRDGGAGLDDAATELSTRGVCTTNTAAMYGVNNPNHRGDWQADRSNHKATRVAWITTPEQLDSALQRGHPVVFGTDVNSSFSPDANGCVGKKRGVSGGGHCMFLYGMQHKNGEWWYRVQNSWGAWGMRGRAVLHPSWVTPSAYGSFTILDTTYHSGDSTLP